MIRILKTIRKEQGLCLIKTELDAKAACIETEYEKEYVGNCLEHKLQKLSDDVNNDMKTKYLKDFLIESVFTHYIDMVAIIDYIYAMKKTIKTIMSYPSHSKFLFVTEFKNYIDDQSDLDSNLDTGEKEKLVGTSFKVDLLKKNNLKFVEKIIFNTLNFMYEDNIVALKPKKTKVFLEEQEEFMHINMTFDDQTK